ncbi:thiamine pyrophosphate-binding protein [Pseudactinotalea suaedae]|uniref:thiamine pyrophosphate-binding protein n=1 Tax=Pseudactinotalea suaedae TaxID=1524924 RepID=UPI0012E12D54|nr:thiamine pyrophosphate-binding protein [Pseudactinotalea suaedae]
MTTLSAHVARTLAHHVDHVFGVMGNGNAHLIDALERQGHVGYTPMRHEAGGVVAADAYFRASGRLAAATATYGAGFTNTITALAEAAQARVPLLLIAGEAPTSGLRPWDVDQNALASAVGVRTYTVGRADAGGTVVLAIEHALSYRTPVVLALPYDVVTTDVVALDDGEARLEPRVARPQGPSGEVARARVAGFARALATAERPLLLAGRGAWLSGAGPALGRVADLTGALTTTTALGRNLFPRPEYDLGVAGGFGADGAMALIHEADVALVVGASLNQFTMRYGDLLAPRAQVLQIDAAASATHPQVSGFVSGDARLVAEALSAELEGLGAAPSGWRDRVEVTAARTYPRGAGQCADGRLDPRSAAARIAELLPADRIVVADGGHFLGWSNMYWPVAAPDRVIMVGTAFQSIGLGFPSVAGAARANPEATVVLTTGDGGGLMAAADLESAVRVAGGRGLAVVWNDGGYGAEIHVYGRQGLAPEPMLIPQVDFAALATAMGGEGVAVGTLEDLEALASWAARPASARPFLLLDLRISPTVVAPYMDELLRASAGAQLTSPAR